MIVDDEAPARARLRQMLAAHPGIEIVAEAETGVEAMEKTAGSKPDLLLLDIQMPGSSGIEVAASLPSPAPSSSSAPPTTSTLWMPSNCMPSTTC